MQARNEQYLKRNVNWPLRRSKLVKDFWAQRVEFHAYSNPWGKGISFFLIKKKKKTDIKMLKNKNFGRQISATVSMKLTHNKDRFKLQIFYKKKLLKKKKPKH